MTLSQTAPGIAQFIRRACNALCEIVEHAGVAESGADIG
jgi:hypothetical protein